MIRAAGTLCVDPNGHVLLVHRTDGQGWSTPGGHIEDGESAQRAAQRELEEETKHEEKLEALLPWTRRIKDGVDFTTFLVKVPEQFTPRLDGEHDQFRWVDRHVALDSMELHPGVKVALLLPDLDELGVAKAIRAGELMSPWRYKNVLLIALRITGTGAAYRLAEKEFVWRDESLYLNDEFLQRCNGLPVIWVHPENKPQLNSKEFHDRIVGTVFLPYILENEVWGIAKIYDDGAMAVLEENTPKLSTSPCVVLRPDGSSSKYRLQDGSIILIEGKPALLDHLAIVEVGVWDKAGEPSGVLNQLEDPKMPEATLAPAAAAPPGEAKSDSDVKLDKILTHMDSFQVSHKALADGQAALCSRMDAFEAAHKPAEGKEPVAPAAVAPGGEAAPLAVDRKDGEAQPGKESEGAALASERDPNHLQPADSAMADSNSKRINELEAQIKTMNQRIPTDMPEEDRLKFVAVQERAERVAQAFGDAQGAPRWLHGETLDQYRRRMANKFRTHSPAWKDIDITPFAGATLVPVETQIYADAMNAAMHPSSVEGGQLRQVIEQDATGRRIKNFYGDPEVTWGPFKLHPRLVSDLRTKFN
jgi:8-oxo-dGTP pyrophosphatase MutT (NUDIX family)